jgi:hypothetical protein
MSDHTPGVGEPVTMTNRVPSPIMRKVRGFFQRHERLITFGATFIVFATFIAKETIAEELKGAAESRLRAIDMFENKDEGNRVVFFFKEIERQIVSKGQTSAESELESRLRDIEDGVYVLVNRSMATSVFAEDLKDRSFKPQIENCIKRALDLEGEFSKMNDSKPKTITADYAHTLDSFEDRIADQTFVTMGIKMDISSKAKSEEERLSWWYRAFTRVSYFLYGIGWGIGLAAKLFGVQAPESAL